jgi:hypothetical protein
MRRGIKIKTGSNSGSGSSTKSRSSNSRARQAAVAVNPLLVNPRKGYYHPFAEVQSPIDKWQELGWDCMESAWFFIYDSVAYSTDKLWQILVTIVFIPIGIMGLIFDKLRILISKVTNPKLLTAFYSAPRKQSVERDRQIRTL